MLQPTPFQRADIGLPNAPCHSEKSLSGWSPMMRQYLSLRVEAKALLAYQLGDFCEFFFQDAVTVSQICNIYLSNRGAAPDGTDIQMCGLPNPSGFPADGNSCVTSWSGNDRLYAAILHAGYPLAFAVQTGVVGGVMQRAIIARFEPRAKVLQ